MPQAHAPSRPRPLAHAVFSKKMSRGRGREAKFLQKKERAQGAGMSRARALIVHIGLSTLIPRALIST